MALNHSQNIHGNIEFGILPKHKTEQLEDN